MIYPFFILYMMERGVIHTEHKPLGRLYLGVIYLELIKVIKDLHNLQRRPKSLFSVDRAIRKAL